MSPPNYIKKFLERWDDDREKLYFIGRGAAGTVLLDRRFPGLVFKISTSTNKCRDWKREIAIVDMMKKRIVANDVIIDLPLVSLNMPHYHEVHDSKGVCVIQMPRVISLNKDKSVIVHPLFGVSNNRQQIEGRGHFLGRDELIQEGYFNSEEAMLPYMSELGSMMGILHYIIGVNGFDLEVLIGIREDSPKLVRLFIVDYDLFDFNEKFNIKDAIKNMEWSLSAVDYFPSKSDAPLLYKTFETAYLSKASSVDSLDIANKVLTRFNNNN